VSEFPAPPVTELSQPYWDGLAAGELRFQRCTACGNAWLPPREECPRCWGDRWTFEASCGRGTLVSWVIYHKAYHPYFQDRLPYNVAVVELAEGPRLLTNVEVDDHGELAIDREVVLSVSEESGWSLARFRLADPAPTR
jgi:uncharacterized protein